MSRATDEMHFGGGDSQEAPAPRRTLFADVGDFHQKMGLPVAGHMLPRQLTNEEFDYRRDFMLEELTEFTDAFAENDGPGMADALVDLVYVALGTAHYMGLPFDELWDEVQRANMAKRRWREGDPVKPRAAGAPGLDVVKPEGWVGPDIAGVLGRFRERVGGRYRK
jgi:predicted HAD superfamily Cof-like phosphohydrolase